MKKKNDNHKLKEAFDAAFIRRDHMAVVLEKIQDDFRVFGEQLHGFDDRLIKVEEKVDATFEEVGDIKVEIVILSKRVEKLEERIEKLEERVSEIAHDTSSIRKDIAFIKERLTEKIDRTEFIALEKRVSSIELKMQK